jgi:hypothetical protein
MDCLAVSSYGGAKREDSIEPPCLLIHFAVFKIKLPVGVGRSRAEQRPINQVSRSLDLVCLDWSIGVVKRHSLRFIHGEGQARRQLDRAYVARQALWPGDSALVNGGAH